MRHTSVYTYLYLIKIQYIGVAFHAFINQEASCVYAVLKSILGRGVVIRQVSRTDKGVSACAQLISIRSDRPKMVIIQKAVSRLLTHKVVLSKMFIPKGIEDPFPKSVVKKIYRYSLSTNHHDGLCPFIAVVGHIALEKIISHIPRLESLPLAYMQASKKINRSIAIQHSRIGNRLHLYFSSKGFGMYQIRAIVDTLIRLASGVNTLDDFQLNNDQPIPVYKSLAEPSGLTLLYVEFDIPLLASFSLGPYKYPT